MADEPRWVPSHRLLPIEPGDMDPWTDLSGKDMREDVRFVGQYGEYDIYYDGADQTLAIVVEDSPEFHNYTWVTAANMEFHDEDVERTPIALCALHKALKEITDAENP